MGLSSMYKAQKNKRNITKGAKELQGVEKLSKATVLEIDNYIKTEKNINIKNDLIMLKAMISVDLSSRDNIAISNYLYGRLLRTQVASEYGIAKKKNQINILENNAILLENENTSSFLEKSKTILSKNIAIARNLISVTEGYAISNKDLLPRNEKEFDLYLTEYDTYIEERVSEINDLLLSLNNLSSLDNDLKNSVELLLNNLDYKEFLKSKENIDEYIISLFNYDLKISETLLIFKELKISLNTENEILNILENIIVNYNKIIIMITQNIFKITKPFNKKIETLLLNFDLEKKIESDFKILTSVNSKILNLSL